MGITDDLYFNVLGILQIFFKINLVIAKCFFCFALRQVIGSDRFLSRFNHAHATTATAINSLDDNGIAMGCTKVQHLLQGVYGAIAAGNHGDAGQLCLLAGIDFVTKHNQML